MGTRFLFPKYAFFSPLVMVTIYMLGAEKANFSLLPGFYYKQNENPLIEYW